MTCITIYSPVLRAPQEGYNELQRVTMGYKPLWGKQPDRQHVSDFPRVADGSLETETKKFARTRNHGGYGGYGGCGSRKGYMNSRRLQLTVFPRLSVVSILYD